MANRPGWLWLALLAFSTTPAAYGRQDDGGQGSGWRAATAEQA